MGFTQAHTAGDKQGVIGQPRILADLQRSRACKLVALALDVVIEVVIRIDLAARYYALRLFALRDAGLTAVARAADADVARVRLGAKPAGEADPYRDSGTAAESATGAKRQTTTHQRQPTKQLQ